MTSNSVSTTRGAQTRRDMAHPLLELALPPILIEDGIEKRPRSNPVEASATAAAMMPIVSRLKKSFNRKRSSVTPETLGPTRKVPSALSFEQMWCVAVAALRCQGRWTPQALGSPHHPSERCDVSQAGGTTRPGIR